MVPLPDPLQPLGAVPPARCEHEVGGVWQNGALDLNLLQHHLRNEHVPWVPRAAPGQIPGVLQKPGEQGRLDTFPPRGV